MESNGKIYVAGHRGMVGSAIVRRLEKGGFKNIVVRTSSQLDLRNQQAVQDFFNEEKPEYVFLAAAKVGGILANNTYRAEFLYDNLMIEANVIHNSYLHKVKKLLFLGSSCIYPKQAPQPLTEESLLSGYLEETNEPYAIAKIAGIKMCENYRRQYGCDFISAMPTNLYGQNDNYDLQTSHVIPALIRKFTEAMANGADKVEIWGTGKPKREFMHVDDLADACYFLMLNYSGESFINIGTGTDLTISDLAEMIGKFTGFRGKITYDTTKPDGTPRKIMNVEKLTKMGWRPSISLADGLRQIVDSYKTISEVSK